MKRILAFDFGASSGRAMLGIFNGETIELQEIHRFSNDPVNVNGTVYWDILRLFHEIKQGLLKAKAAGGFDSIGIDTWGVDFGFIDEFGNLVENPVHYRDLRTVGMIDTASELMDKNQIYSITGIQFMELNTVFQLLSLVKQRPHILERADKLLFIPDLMNYMLTGIKTTEYSIATTSQMVDIKNQSWSAEIIQNLSIPRRLLTEIVPTGTVVGNLSQQVCNELDLSPVKVIAVAGHDTQSAVTAVPSTEKDFLFISCGTWSLLGTEVEEPIINEKSAAYNITNEGGYDYSTAFLKNICGLWLIQESRRQWQREGTLYSYADLERLALAAQPLKCFINPDAPEFAVAGNLPKRVQEFCQQTGQYVPQTVGEIMRCIYESLAMKYRKTAELVEDCTGKNYDKIHIIGGGTKDTLLCRMTADFCNREVLAGPIEATVLGNIAVQLLSQGEIESITKAREIIAKSEKLIRYQPETIDGFEQAYERFLKVN